MWYGRENAGGRRCRYYAGVRGVADNARDVPEPLTSGGAEGRRRGPNTSPPRGERLCERPRRRRASCRRAARRAGGRGSRVRRRREWRCRVTDRHVRTRIILYLLCTQLSGGVARAPDATTTRSRPGRISTAAADLAGNRLGGGGERRPSVCPRLIIASDGVGASFRAPPTSALGWFENERRVVICTLDAQRRIGQTSHSVDDDVTGYDNWFTTAESEIRKRTR